MVVVLVIGGLPGAFRGAWAWRTRLYPRGPRGVVLGVVDATWSLPNTPAGAVFQARLFGPLYLPLVVLNWVVATVLPYWPACYDRAPTPVDGVRAHFRHGVYPHCRHEEWAYRRGTPPRGGHEG